MAGPSGRYRSRGTRDEGTCVKSNLQGKVTGGSSGIGLAAGKMLVEAGAYVFIMGRRQSALGKAKDLIGQRVSVVRGDVASFEDLDKLYETRTRKLGRYCCGQ